MTPPLARVLRLNPSDNVALALAEVSPGTRLTEGSTTSRTTIRPGHKIALSAIAAGETIRKYGQVIGVATTDIAPGDHVHSHNLRIGGNQRSDDVGTDVHPVLPAQPQARFLGYRNPTGRAGTRNYVGVLTSVNCSATVARKIAAAFSDDDMPGTCDGVAAFTHTTGCGTPKTGEGVDNLTRTIMGYARNPNFASVIVVGLGCEVNQIERMLSEAGLERSDRLHAFTIQDAGGTLSVIEKGKGLARELVADAAQRERESLPASELMLGLQCGGSDGWSGVTANPALGAAVDLLIAHGGTAILSETPEIYGAESLLLRRAVSRTVADQLLARLDWWEAYAAQHGASLDNNPSPGNLEGGLTTILEKSLGAVAKSGTAPLTGVYRYGEPIDGQGFVFMDSPGYDPCSATGQIASGANLLAFTTGRGSVFGAKPTPCLKLASNANLARHMVEDMDIDASPILSGTPVRELGELVFARLLSMASGDKSKSELLGLGDNEFVPWQLGAWM